MFFSYEAWQFGKLGLLLIAAAIVLWLSQRPTALPAGARANGRPAWEAGAVALLALDLLAAGWGFNPAAEPRLLNHTPPVVDFLAQDRSLWRFTTYDPDGRKPFNANTGWFFDFQDVRGYDSIIPRQYAAYMGLIEPQGELQFNRIASVSNLQSLNSPLLDLLNVKYVVSLAEIDLPKFRLVYDGEVKVYENLAVAPRAFSLPVSSAAAMADPVAALQAYDPRQYVLLEASAETPSGVRPRPGVLAPAEVTAYGANEVTVQAEIAEPAYLVLGDSYAPGWRAFLRPLSGEVASAEKEVTIQRANGNFRAVYLEPGAWSVRFRYSPMPVRLGGFVSLMAALALALAAGIWLWRYFYREAALDSTARRVAKNSLAPLALNLFNRLIDLVFAAFMLRILGPADAGKYYFAAVIIVWFDTLAGFGLNTFLTREAARDPASSNRLLATTTLLRLALGAAAFAALAAGVYAAWRYGGLAGDTALAILLLAIALLPGSLSAGLTALFQAHEKHEYPAAVTTVTTVFKVGLGAAALVLGYGFVGLAGTSIAVNFVTLALLGGLAARLLPVRVTGVEYDRAWQGRVLRESWPLMVNNLLAGLFFKVDVALLEPIRNARQSGLGSREVGWYSTAYKYVEAYNLVPSLFTFALFPVMSRQAAGDRPALARGYALAVKLLFGAALPLAAMTTFLAHTMIGLLGGNDFLPHGAIALQLMVWSIPFGWINSLTNYLLIALGQQRALTRAFLVGLGFNVIANLIFLPRYGYPAAAIISILSEIVEGIPFYLALRRSLAPVPWARLLWKPMAAAAAMAGLMAGLWPWQPLLALGLGPAVYIGLLAGLRLFDPEEWATLVEILPRRLRRAPRMQPGAAPAQGGN
jgi:O-antigen/teichoic acid export membrane protein